MKPTPGSDTEFVVRIAHQLPENAFDGMAQEDDKFVWSRPPRPGPYGNAHCDFLRPFRDVILQLLQHEPRYARDLRDSANYWTDGRVVYDRGEMIRALQGLAKAGVIRPAGSVWRWEITEGGREELATWWPSWCAKQDAIAAESRRLQRGKQAPMPPGRWSGRRAA